MSSFTCTQRKPWTHDLRCSHDSWRGQIVASLLLQLGKEQCWGIIQRALFSVSFLAIALEKRNGRCPPLVDPFLSDGASAVCQYLQHQPVFLCHSMVCRSGEGNFFSVLQKNWCAAARNAPILQKKILVEPTDGVKGN